MKQGPLSYTYIRKRTRRGESYNELEIPLVPCGVKERSQIPLTPRKVMILDIALALTYSFSSYIVSFSLSAQRAARFSLWLIAELVPKLVRCLKLKWIATVIWVERGLDEPGVRERKRKREKAVINLNNN